MSNQKIQTPFTKIPQIFLKLSDEYPLNPYQFRVLSLIYDYTAGFNKTTCKLSNVKISKETGISISKIGNIIKSACAIGGIKYEKLTQGYQYEITVLPLGKGNIFSKKIPNYLQGKSDSLQGNVSRPAIDNTIDNIIDKDRYLFFKSKYPEVKCDEPITQWNALTDQDRIDVCEVMEFQNNIWNQLDDAQFVPKASNYLLKTEFKHEKVYAALRDKRRREDAKIKQQDYFNEADKNAADSDEIKEIFKQVKLDKTR